MVNLNVNIGSLKLKNPVLVASGTFGYGEEFAELYDISKLGAVVTKGVSLKPCPGNPMPRVCETPSGMINSIGLENVGIEAFLKDKLSFLRKKKATVVVNIFGETIDEYVELAKQLDGARGVHALELNISCPNVRAGGIQFGVDTFAAAKLTEKVRNSTRLALILKLSPMVKDIGSIAKAVEIEGADAVSLINTIPAMAVDAKTRRPRIANVVGGLSGPAIKPIALRQVWEVYDSVNVPVIGMGGIMGVEDALEFIIAGASAIQIGTANFIKPLAAIDIIDGLGKYLREQSLSSVSDIVGCLKI